MVGPYRGAQGFAPIQMPSEKKYTPSWLALLDSSFRQENIVSSAAFSFGLNFERMFGDMDSLPDDPNFDPFDTIVGSKYEPYIDSFIGVRNTYDQELIKQKIDQELKDRKVMAQSNGTFATAMLAGVVDPLIFIPVVGIASKANRARKMVNVALQTGAAVGIQESILQATQEIRPLEESRNAIVASMVLGGILGAAVPTNPKARRGMSVGLQDDLDGIGKKTRLIDELQRNPKASVDDIKKFIQREAGEIVIVDDVKPNDLDEALAGLVDVSKFQEYKSLNTTNQRLQFIKQQIQGIQYVAPKTPHIDLIGDPSVKYGMMDYVEDEIRSVLQEDFTDQEILDYVKGMLEMGISPTLVENSMKRIIEPESFEGFLPRHRVDELPTFKYPYTIDDLTVTDEALWRAKADETLSETEFQDFINRIPKQRVIVRRRGTRPIANIIDNIYNDPYNIMGDIHEAYAVDIQLGLDFWQNSLQPGIVKSIEREPLGSDGPIALHNNIEDYIGINDSIMHNRELSRQIPTKANDGYLVPTTKNMQHLLDHEFGHAIDYALPNEVRDKFTDIYDGLGNTKIGQEISRYAAKKREELFAESWSWYINQDYGKEFISSVGHKRQYLPQEIVDFFEEHVINNPAIIPEDIEVRRWKHDF